MLHNRLVVTVFVLERLEKFAEPRNIQQLDETWKSGKTKQFRGDTRGHQHVKREDRDEIDQKPSVKVVHGYCLQVSDRQLRVRIKKLLKEVKYEIYVEEDLNCLVYAQMERICGLSECYI